MPFTRAGRFVLPVAVVLIAAAFSLSASGDVPPVPRLGATPHPLFLDKGAFLNQPQSFYYFHLMDRLGFQQDWVRRAGPVYPLQDPSAPFTAAYRYRGNAYTLDQYFKRNFTTGFLVLKDDRILYERYFYGATADSRFLSNSMAKSITSTLVGAAIADGKIRSVNDRIVDYLPYLAASPGFRNTTIKQILEMATGLKFNENYLDAKAQVHELTNALFWGTPSFKDLAISIGAKTKPGTVFEYQSVNTEVLGLLLEKVTGEPLNQYLQEKIWSRIGAQSDAFLYRAKTQVDQCAFGCFNATLRDYARFALMFERGGVLAGRRVVSDAWVREATTPGAPFLQPLPRGPKDQATQGYAYQWWIPYGPDHAFEALGVYGQIIYVNPVRHVVIVDTSAWPEPDTDAMWDESQKLIDTIAEKL